jgi:hypothetical protein
MFESFDVLRWSFSKSFDSSVGAVAYVTHNLMPCCGALRKESVANTLNIASYQELSRYTRHDCDLKNLYKFSLRSDMLWSATACRRFVTPDLTNT